MVKEEKEKGPTLTDQALMNALKDTTISLAPNKEKQGLTVDIEAGRVLDLLKGKGEEKDLQRAKGPKGSRMVMFAHQNQKTGELLPWVFFDVDVKEGERLDYEVRKGVIEHPSTFLYHRSASGRGAHFHMTKPEWLTAENFERYYPLICDHLEAKITGLKVDRQCKNVNRLKFLTIDPGLIHNPEALPLNMEDPSRKPKQLKEQQTEYKYETGTPAIIEHLLAKFDPHKEGNRNSNMLKIGHAFGQLEKGGYTAEDLAPYLAQIEANLRAWGEPDTAFERARKYAYENFSPLHKPNDPVTMAAEEAEPLDIEKLIETLRVLPDVDYGGAEPALSYFEKPVIINKSWVNLYGPAKAGKTTLIKLIIRHLLGIEEGVFTSTVKTERLLYFDTEQHPSEIQPHLRGALEARADEVYYFHLAELSVKARIQTIEALCNHYQPGILVVDNIADLTPDFNDNIEASKLADWLGKLQKTTDSLMLTVIHTTAQGTKAKGHAGSIVMTKASANWHLETNGLQSWVGYKGRLVDPGKFEFDKDSLTRKFIGEKSKVPDFEPTTEGVRILTDILIQEYGEETGIKKQWNKALEIYYSQKNEEASEDVTKHAASYSKLVPEVAALIEEKHLKPIGKKYTFYSDENDV